MFCLDCNQKLNVKNIVRLCKKSENHVYCKNCFAKNSENKNEINCKSCNSLILNKSVKDEDYENMLLVNNALLFTHILSLSLKKI